MMGRKMILFISPNELRYDEDSRKEPIASRVLGDIPNVPSFALAPLVSQDGPSDLFVLLQLHLQVHQRLHLIVPQSRHLRQSRLDGRPREHHPRLQHLPLQLRFQGLHGVPLFLGEGIERVVDVAQRPVQGIQRFVDVEAALPEFVDPTFKLGGVDASEHLHDLPHLRVLKLTLHLAPLLHLFLGQVRRSLLLPLLVLARRRRLARQR
mmetsp:Transcript_26017/g.53250  ORF Transcript_26017/g.53250 Transcript_26017/m.53250 type:complete len:208 (-) Transcript_26017:1106-1729(-)